MALSTVDRIEWLRRLLEDLPAVELETASASGLEVEFYVNNPPMLTAPAPVVTVAGAVLVEGGDYSIPTERDRVILLVPPTAGATVNIRYWRQTFDDAELTRYLTAAAPSYGADDDVFVVYRAAIYAIDALLMGTATALRFGAGAEDFDLPSVHERLMGLRQMFAEYLMDPDGTGVPAGEAPAIVIQDLYFDTDDPTPDWS